MIQETDRDLDHLANQHADLERRLWRGLVPTTLHLTLMLINWSQVARVIGLVSRHLDRHDPHLTEIDVPVPDLPPALAGLRIGHLTDLHIGHHFAPADAARAVALVQGAAPDLIAMTGDLVDHWPRDIVPAARVVADLSAPFGVFGVLGNHDHRVNAPRLLAALAEHAPNVRMLVNGAERVLLPGGELWLAGLDSSYVGRADARRMLAPVPPGAACLVLSHEPDAADHLPRPVLLTLAGHSHGGQITLRGRPMMLPPWGQRHHTGLNQSDNGLVYTSRGVGWTGLPLRHQCPPEVAVLRLVPAPPSP